MAEVFKGVSYGAQGFERLSAVKRVLPHVAEEKDFIEMFIDEAQIAAQLQHPNIGQVFHLGQSDGKYFIAMEFISGQDLRALFERARELQQPLDLGWCAYIVREVCAALEYAHHKRDAQQRPMHLIHRDVSPQNILVGYDGAVKLIDFGIAKANNKINKTEVGILKGKFSYMSPEQARGLPLDPRTDLFALAIVLYELVTLERCFLGQTDFSTIERVRNIEYTAPRKLRREVPSALEKIIHKGLSRDPNDRYQSASDFQEALNKFLRKYAPRFTRAHAHDHMQRLFNAEVSEERARFDEFRRYAAEHIPEASRSAAAGGRGRFDPQLSAPRDDSKARYAVDEPRFSINPRLERTSELAESSRPSPQAPASVGARLALLTALAALSAAAVVLFVQSRAPQRGSLRLNTNTYTPARFTLTGEGVTREGQAPALLRGLPSGRYTVQIEADGYAPQALNAEVKGHKTIDLAPQSLPLMGVGFRPVASKPSGAEVRLDGRLIGSTPLTLVGSLGAHQLTLNLPHYSPLTTQVTLSDPPPPLEELILLPAQVVVHLTPTSPQAKVYLKSRRARDAWRFIGLGEQRLQLTNDGDAIARVTLEGFEPQEVIFPRYPQAEVTERVELIPLTEAKEAREKPPTPQPVREPPQRVRRKTRPQQRRRVTQRSTPPSRPATPPPAAPPSPPPREAQPGFLKLITIPPAEVFYQGRSLGWTPLNDYKLPEGHYTFTLRLDGGETYTIRQSVQAGRSVLRRWRKP
jgi:serine/threonine protein kinase